MMRHLTRETLVTVTAAGALCAAVAFAQSELELVIVSWGGAYTASQQQAYHENESMVRRRFQTLVGPMPDTSSSCLT